MTDVDKKTGYFKIIYEDGDNEELQGDELLKLLGKMSRQKKKQPELEVAAIPKAAPRRATQDASTTLHEFVRNAAHAARRKRKHTNMVRRGVFKDREAKERAKEEARQKAETEAAEVEAAAAAAGGGGGAAAGGRGGGGRCGAGRARAARAGAARGGGRGGDRGGAGVSASPSSLVCRSAGPAPHASSSRRSACSGDASHPDECC